MLWMIFAHCCEAVCGCGGDADEGGGGSNEIVESWLEFCRQLKIPVPDKR